MVVFDGDTPEPLEVDGSLDQRSEIAQLIGELRDERRRLQTTLDEACGLLRDLMQGHQDPAQRVLSVKSRDYDVRLVAKQVIHCCEHNEQIDRCAAEHAEQPVNLRLVEVARGWVISRRGLSRPCDDRMDADDPDGNDVSCPAHRSDVGDAVMNAFEPPAHDEVPHETVDER